MTNPAKHKPSLKRHFDVYTDGSAFSDGRQMGAGWVVYEGDKKRGAYSQPVLTPKKGSSTLAEINAATLGLLSIPEGANATLHSDCEAVLSYLRQGNTNSAYNSNNEHKQEINLAVTELFGAAARLGKLELVKSNDKCDDRLREAHNLAQHAAMNVPRPPSPKS